MDISQYNELPLATQIKLYPSYNKMTRHAYWCSLCLSHFIWNATNSKVKRERTYRSLSNVLYKMSRYDTNLIRWFEAVTTFFGRNNAQNDVCSDLRTRRGNVTSRLKRNHRIQGTTCSSYKSNEELDMTVAEVVYDGRPIFQPDEEVCDPND